jgi:hypothetical protein
MTKKMMYAVLTLVFLSLTVFYPVNGIAGPPPKMVKEVVDYFYSGQDGGPILTDSKLCTSIKALECETAVDPKAVSMGEAINVWMQFFVPKGSSYDDIVVEYKHEGVPRNLKAHKIEGSIRYRLADKYKLDKPGKWTIAIKKGLTNLKMFNITVVEK